ncbi:hypothetical protein HQ447_18725 [bacterium]|nr:hypothetical protein [bacterium]
MKPNISLAVFMALLLGSIICAGSTVNNEQEEFQLVQGAILQFQKDTNEFPTSWDDLWDNKASRPIVESLDQGKIFGRRTDMLESFRFIASGTTIRIPEDGSTVVGMMTRPMRPPPETRRRFLIVRLKDGTRGLKQIPEDVLQNIFSKVGFNLEDYTGPNGNWAPETRLRHLSQIPRPELALLDPSLEHSTIPAHPYFLTTKRKRELWIAGGIALLLLIVIGCLRFTAKRGFPQRKK